MDRVKHECEALNMSVYFGNPSYAIEPSDRDYYCWLDQMNRRDACIEAFVSSALDELVYAASVDKLSLLVMPLIQETMESFFEAIFSSEEKNATFSVVLLKIWRNHRQDQEEDAPERKLAQLLETEIMAYAIQQAQAKC